MRLHSLSFIALILVPSADWLEKVIERRDTRVMFLARELLQTNSRWPTLAKMLKLPEAIQ